MDGFDLDDFAGFSEPQFRDNDEIAAQSHEEFSAAEADIIEQCVLDRVFFAEVVLGVVLEAWQRRVLEALDRGETRISIRSGNGAGKTCLLAIIILHYILFRDDVKVPVTAPSSGQLTDGLIPECSKWMGKLPDFLRRLIGTTQSRIVRLDNPTNNFVSFRTARKEKPEALQGIHASFVMCVVDEASGVDDAVYEAAQGTLSTPGAIFIMISNPTRLSGYFHKSHNANKHMWVRFHVTAFDTSRVDQAFVETIRSTYGENSDQYRVKVLGEFPSREESTLIAKDIAEAAVGRDIAMSSGDHIMGVDVGRGGDLSALAVRCGDVIYKIKKQNYADTMATVGWVVETYKELKVKPTAIYVDSIGIGAGVADRLRELNYPAIDVNVGELPSLKTTYPRMRDELWWTTKTWLETMSVSIRDDAATKEELEMLIDELTTPLQLFTSTGKNGVESKAQMRSRGYRSPNLADAVCLTFSYDTAVGAGLQRSSKSAWDKPIESKGAAHVW
jgi:phage terminase large subunit